MEHSLLAQRATDRTLVGIEEVDSGLACNCVCVGCGARVIARKGDVRTHHFAHESGAACSGETWLHQALKAVIEEEKRILLPQYYLPLSDSCTQLKIIELSVIQQEVPAPGSALRPDITARGGAKGNALFIEVHVHHAVDEAKRNALAQLGVPTLELSVPREMLSAQPTRTDLSKFLDNPDCVHWIVPPQLAEARAKAVGLVESIGARLDELAAYDDPSKRSVEGLKRFQDVLRDVERDQHFLAHTLKYFTFGLVSLASEMDEDRIRNLRKKDAGFDVDRLSHLLAEKPLGSDAGPRFARLLKKVAIQVDGQKFGDSDFSAAVHLAKTLLLSQDWVRRNHSELERSRVCWEDIRKVDNDLASLRERLLQRFVDYISRSVLPVDCEKAISQLSALSFFAEAPTNSCSMTRVVSDFSAVRKRALAEKRATDASKVCADRAVGDDGWYDSDAFGFPVGPDLDGAVERVMETGPSEIRQSVNGGWQARLRKMSLLCKIARTITPVNGGGAKPSCEAKT